MDGATEWTGSDKKIPVYDNFNWAGSLPENRIGILLGVADMGFRLTFSTQHEKQSFDNVRNTATGTNYKHWESERGYIAPQIAWSMAKDLTPNGIRPWLNVDFGFVKNNSLQDTYTAAGSTASSGTTVNNSENYMQAIINLGLGGYTFYKNDKNFRASFDIEDSLTLRGFDNQYHYFDGASNKTKSIKGLNNGTTLTENSYVQNVFTPYVASQWSGGPLALRLQLRLPLTLRGEESKVVGFDPAANNGNLSQDGPATSVFYVGFAPQLRLAAQWRIDPKLSLFAGGRITLNAIGQTTTENGDDYNLGTKVDNTATTKVDNVFGTTGNQLTLGVTFLPTDNMTFEAVCGAANGNLANNEINVFDPNNGIFRFASLLVSLKF